MKKVIVLLTILMLALSPVLPVYAADGSVIYQGNAEQFIFEPGSNCSLVDLFPNFKEAMPGDTLTQRITLKNNSTNKVVLYVRSLGTDTESAAFLSQLNLKVAQSDADANAYLYSAPANQAAQLTDWVCLGALDSGGLVDLDFVLTVPVTLDNEFQDIISYLDWEFKAEVSSGPYRHFGHWCLWLGLLIGLLAALLIVISRRKKEKNSNL